MTDKMNHTELKAAWLFPDILYLHGERGNILALQRVASAAGLTLTVDRIDYETTDFDPMAYDFIFCPPGEIASFETLIQWFLPYKSAFTEFIEAGKVLLVTGTSQCLFGNKICREDGTVIEGLGLIDCDYSERKAVYGDDLYFRAYYGDGEEMEIFGSQIQMMDVYSREPAFGDLIYGFGNTGKDRQEGVLKKNSIFSNTLGPILVLNPWLTKKIVIHCMENIGIEIAEFDLDVSLELQSLKTKREFTTGKVTKLTNCK